MSILDVFGKKDDSKKSDNPLDPANMGFMQRMAMKKLEKMSPAEREALMRKVMTPENIQKNKADILKTLEHLKKTGQMNDHQIFEAKKRLGIL